MPFRERITIQNKCYEIRGLHRWIIEGTNKKLLVTQTYITPEDKQRLINAYTILSLVPNILTRDKLIQIYSYLQQEIMIFLSPKVPWHIKNILELLLIHLQMQLHYGLYI